jgi:hypothetical protein
VQIPAYFDRSKSITQNHINFWIILKLRKLYLETLLAAK